MRAVKDSGPGHMNAHGMNVEQLSRPELLMLLSMLEGELEARDQVIEVLKAQRRDAFVQERYSLYRSNDPFLALQRDCEVVPGPLPEDRAPLGPAPQPSPLTVLQLVVTHCKRMQQKMLAQLAAAEHRHRKVIADLEEEKRRHAQDTAEGDDVTYMLEKDRERLLQQLDFEKTQLRRLEKEQRRLLAQVEEERVQHRQISASLVKECQRASARSAELSRKLDEERVLTQGLLVGLEEERERMRLELEAEREHLGAENKRLRAELGAECQQLKTQLRQGEEHNQMLQTELERLELGRSVRDRDSVTVVSMTSVASQTEVGDNQPPEVSLQPKLNGHHPQEADFLTEECGQENGHDNRVAYSPTSFHQGLDSSSAATSPCSSPLLVKRQTSLCGSPGYQSSYQASITQRFQAARHKFQGPQEQESQGGSMARSPRDLSPVSTPTEPGSVKQMARHTVTQVLSRFTCQQGSAKPPAPFGTDYRTLAQASLVTGKSSNAQCMGVKSPKLPRTERGNPPPIPPKKPGLAQSPASPSPTARASHFPELSIICGFSSTQEDNKERDLVMSSPS
ncbi:CTTNBP2 N-terminal-like protein [Brienomyrus brachyistius]|uniref:CTTNBP2 N-terminal-like protein n=1 Tax=Brienomyrus brachyistius TaxID=42636 RepID=UPI0020B34977|nr:CTTNBP2 N-terminal-like protein [Brienomyrus brachyistius]